MENKENKNIVDKFIDAKTIMSIGVLGGMLQSGLFTVGGFALPTLSTLALPLGIGGIAVGSLYGCYRIATKSTREYDQKILLARDLWSDFFMACGLKDNNKEIPILVNIWEKEYGKVFSFIRPLGVCTADLQSKYLTIKEFIGCTDVKFTTEGDFINIEAIETELPSIIPFIMPKRESDELIVDMGYNTKGEKVKINFSKMNSLLLAGATGTGKSVATHCILTQLYSNYSDICEFYLCDFKKVELCNYRNLKKTIKYIDKVDEAEKLIDELLIEADRRAELFIKENVKNLNQYNKKVRKENQLPNIVVCMEEVVRLMSDKKVQAKLAELGFICRSSGIVLILTIQRPTKNLLSPDIKASLLMKIGFMTVNRINSQVICEDTRLFDIKDGRGHCWVFADDISVGEQEARVMYLEEDKIDSILQKHCEYK